MSKAQTTTVTLKDVDGKQFRLYLDKTWSVNTGLLEHAERVEAREVEPTAHERYVGGCPTAREQGELRADTRRRDELVRKLQDLAALAHERLPQDAGRIVHNLGYVGEGDPGRHVDVELTLRDVEDLLRMLGGAR